MSTYVVFPFCIISDRGSIKKASGSISITKKNSNNNNISKFEMQTRDWKNQTPDDEIEFEISNKTITDDQIVFGISMEIDDPDSLVLFFNPYVKNTHNFQYLFQSISQQVFGIKSSFIKLKVTTSSKISRNFYITNTCSC